MREEKRPVGECVLVSTCVTAGVKVHSSSSGASVICANTRMPAREFVSQPTVVFVCVRMWFGPPTGILTVYRRCVMLPLLVFVISNVFCTTTTRELSSKPQFLRMNA